MRLKQAILSATVACLLPVLGCQPAADGAKVTQSPAKARLVSATASVGYASLLKDTDRRINGLQARVDERPDDWLTRKHLAAVLLERAGLSNRLEDFARVQRALDEAFEIAPEGSGPLLLAARFNFSIHRLDVAEGYLDKMDRRALQKREEQLNVRALRAQIAFQRGQYELAFEGLSDVAAVVPAAAKAELGLYHAKTGAPDEAQMLLEEAFEATSVRDVRQRAWTKLQLGLIAMDHGRYDEALARLQEADAELPGWWLVREHLAEVYNLLDDHGKAIDIFEEIVNMNGLPQQMDTLAGLYELIGLPQKARDLSQQAGAIWDEQLARFPEAAMGHGLSHYLRYGAPERALGLAKANYAVRPGGEAQVSLARAYLKAERPGDALEVIQQVLAGPYRTASLHDVAAQAHAALGHTDAAEDQRKLCMAVNPRYQGQHAH